MQSIQLLGAFSRIRRQQIVDLVLHHAAHAAHRLVVVDGDGILAACVVLVEPRQGQRQQWQRVGTAGRVLGESVDELWSKVELWIPTRLPFGRARR